MQIRLVNSAFFSLVIKLRFCYQSSLWKSFGKYEKFARACVQWVKAQCFILLPILLGSTA